MNFVNKDTIRGVLFGAGLGLLCVTSYAWADPPATSLRPNSIVSTDSKAMLGATRLFKVENCEVWGFTWKDQARVVSVCPAGATQPTAAPVEVKPIVTMPVTSR